MPSEVLSPTKWDPDDRFLKKDDLEPFFRRFRFDNAHTDCELTSFYFEIQRRKFKQALDMFAQFFIEPLMQKSAMTRLVSSLGTLKCRERKSMLRLKED